MGGSEEGLGEGGGRGSLAFYLLFFVFLFWLMCMHGCVVCMEWYVISHCLWSGVMLLFYLVGVWICASFLPNDVYLYRGKHWSMAVKISFYIITLLDW